MPNQGTLLLISKLTDQVRLAMDMLIIDDGFQEFTPETPLNELVKFFETNSFAVVTRRSASDELHIDSIVTKVDLLHYFVSKV